MPVFIEQSGTGRDSRVNPAHLNPLPRLSPHPPNKSSDGHECHEVVIVGAGPAGIMTSVCLARYGITSVLTVDEKPAQLHAGQADGLQPRTLEVLQSLDLAHEVLTQGCQMHEVGFWNPGDGGAGIVRTAFVRDVAVPARYPHEVTIHQGRIERILNEDLERSGNSVQRGWRVKGWSFEEGDEEFPVLVRMVKGEEDGEERVVRTRYLVGADGAHSTVREGMGLKLEGDHTDHVWGVMDAVVKTDFPDIRKRCAIHSSTGSIMIIPRERISGNKVLTRIYCQMEDEVERDPSLTGPSSASTDPVSAKAAAKQRRSKVTLERIISQSQKVLAPYAISFADVDWWAAYQIGQRVTDHFSTADGNGVLRVHIAGDACHTHSPKAGQGMNVSMMDGFNLAWKLAHVVNGLSADGTDLVATYEHERLDIARQLIAFDTEFSSMFSGKIGAESELTHEQFVKVFSTGSGFTSGCGIQYREGLLVSPPTPMPETITASPESGLLVPGRRLMNVRTMRFADANPRDIHDDLITSGRYRIITLLPKSFRETPASFSDAITGLVERLPGRFIGGVVESVVVFSGERGDLEWTDFPECVRERSEWLLLGDHYGCVYETWGVDGEKGAVVVVRPDGYVGCISAGLDQAGAGKYLEGVLKTVGRSVE